MNYVLFQVQGNKFSICRIRNLKEAYKKPLIIRFVICLSVTQMRIQIPNKYFSLIFIQFRLQDNLENPCIMTNVVPGTKECGDSHNMLNKTNLSEQN